MKKRKQRRINSLNQKISNRLSYTIIAFVGLMLLGIFVFAAAPNPGHSYTELDLGPITIDDGITIGDLYSGTYTAPENGLLVQGNVAIGQASYPSKNKLEVEGGVAIGSSYAGVRTAPVNGMIVRGDVGIGVYDPSKKLEVDGQVKATGFCIGGDCISSWSGGGGTPTLAEVLSAGNDANTMIDMDNHAIADVSTLNLANTGEITADDGTVKIGGSNSLSIGGGDLNVAGTGRFGYGNVIIDSNIDLTDGILKDANTVQTNTLEDPEDGILVVNDNLAVGGASGSTVIGIESTGTNIGVKGQGNVDGVRGDGGTTGVFGSGTSNGVYGNSNDIGVRGYGNNYDFYAAGPGTNYGASSSMRWKENIVEIDNALDMVLNIKGVYFDWDKEHGGQNDMGFIAEEIGEYIPEIVSYEDVTDQSNHYTENGEDKLYASGVDYGALTPVLVEAIKEQQEMIKQQNNTINQLKLQMQEICLKDKTYSWC